jgi:hypothetical protein
VRGHRRRRVEEEKKKKKEASAGFESWSRDAAFRIRFLFAIAIKLRS